MHKPLFSLLVLKYMDKVNIKKMRNNYRVAALCAAPVVFCVGLQAEHTSGVWTHRSPPDAAVKAQIHNSMPKWLCPSISSSHTGTERALLTQVGPSLPSTLRNPDKHFEGPPGMSRCGFLMWLLDVSF